MLNTAFRPPPKDIELDSPPPDSVSKISFSPTSDVLAVGSWDNNVSTVTAGDGSTLDLRGVSARC